MIANGTLSRFSGEIVKNIIQQLHLDIIQRNPDSRTLDGVPQLADMPTKRLIFRVFFTIYGKEFELNEIITLNENEYIEKKIFSIKQSFLKNINSTHHYHSDGTYTAIDFSSNNYLSLNISINKFK